ncbi:eukaryotic translation initiation factor 2A-like isoform X2 [Rhopilema esculentum]|uniref:eukaryotic translation initiation factor 2A-like isoform X2 n=1 Tax=Rhopilema esculentum TaxID=499914 RepID=UPI0031D6E9A6
MAARQQAIPHLAVRGTKGLHVIDGKTNFERPEDVVCDPVQNCRCFKFSKDGCLFAWCNSQSLQVVDLKTSQKLFEIPKQKTSLLSFSSCGNYLCTWEGYYTTPDNPKGFNNLEILRVGDGSTVKSFVQKRQDTWEPQWSNDELLCARCVNNEVHFYENRDFSSVSKKLFQQNVTNFSLAPGPSPYKIAIFVKGTKAAPSFVRLFQYPNLEGRQALANRSFFKADKIEMFWNKKGTCVLVLSSTEVDTTGASYYGEQTLHFISIKGEANLVPFDKKGPVYSVDWNPNSAEFCVIYGYMPAKAKIFNNKCEPIFDFGTGPRNLCFYNSHGSILCLAGFGNLRGVMELWNTKEKKLISKPQASDSTHFEWAPDGLHFVTATTSPRLKIGNGYKIWHYTGNVIHECAYEQGHELYQVDWQPVSDGVYKEFAIISVSKPLNAPAKVEAYRPPSARATGKQGIKLHEDEPAQNAKQAELSGAALKNKKKREAKVKQSEPSHQIPASTQQQAAGAPMTENEKKIKNLKKKLRQIEELKQKQKEGKTLEKNQLDKIKVEKELVLEIRELELDS